MHTIIDQNLSYQPNTNHECTNQNLTKITIPKLNRNDSMQNMNTNEMTNNTIPNILLSTFKLFKL